MARIPKPKPTTEEPVKKRRQVGGRPRVDLLVHKDFIAQCIQEGSRYDLVVERLKEERGVEISSTTLQRILVAWDMRKQRRTEVNDALKARVTTLYECRIQDNEMYEILVGEGFAVGPRGLQRLRRNLGLYKQSKPKRRAQNESATLDEQSQHEEEREQSQEDEVLVDPALSGNQPRQHAPNNYYDAEYDREFTPPMDDFATPVGSPTSGPSSPHGESMIDPTIPNGQQQRLDASVDTYNPDEASQQEESFIYPGDGPSPSTDAQPDDNPDTVPPANDKNVWELEQTIREKDQVIEQMAAERDRLLWLLAMAQSQLARDGQPSIQADG